MKPSFVALRRLDDLRDPAVASGCPHGMLLNCCSCRVRRQKPERAIHDLSDIKDEAMPEEYTQTLGASRLDVDGALKSFLNGSASRPCCVTSGAMIPTRS